MTSFVFNHPSSVNIDQIKHDVSKTDLYMENVLTLLDPVFTVPSPECCLSSALQSCIAQAALTSFGRPTKHHCRKYTKSGMMQNARMHELP